MDLSKLFFPTGQNNPAKPLYKYYNTRTYISKLTFMLEKLNLPKPFHHRIIPTFLDENLRLILIQQPKIIIMNIAIDLALPRIILPSRSRLSLILQNHEQQRNPNYKNVTNQQITTIIKNLQPQINT